MICTILYNIVIGIVFYIISQQMLKGLIVEYHRQEYTEYNSAIETFVLKGSKHLPQLESPEQLLEQLLIFLDD